MQQWHLLKTLENENEYSDRNCDSARKIGTLKERAADHFERAICKVFVEQDLVHRISQHLTHKSVHSRSLLC